MKDIHWSYGDTAWRVTTVGDTLFFFADTPGMGIELWKSDGTEAGTVLVKDIYPGPADSTPDFFDPWMVNGNGRLYFVADDGTHSFELWTSDGTPEGTYLVQDFDPSERSRSNNGPEPLVVSGSYLFLTAEPPYPNLGRGSSPCHSASDYPSTT